MEEKMFQEIALEKFAEITGKLAQNDKFQAMALEKFTEITGQLTQNDKFQAMALEYMAKLAQQLTEVREGQKQLDKRMTKLELQIEHEVIDKLKAVYEEVDGIDRRLTSQEEELAVLKGLKYAGV